MKKIMFVLITLLAVCIAISAVSADESWSFSTGTDSNGGQLDYDNGDLNIQGIDFKIPSGFEEVTDEQAIGQKVKGEGFDGYLITSDAFKKGDDLIRVKVVFGPDGQKMDDTTYTPSDAAVNKTIKDKKGFFEEKDDGTVTFNYLEDGKLVEIDAPNENIISSIIV